MFTPGRIGTMKVPNRFIRSATAEFGANPDGTVIDEYYELYKDLARGKVGLIIQGHLYIMDEGKAHEKMAGIVHDYHLKGLKQIVSTIHGTNSDSKVAAQLNHGGIHSVSKKAPSILDGKEGYMMTEDDIESVIKSFGSAALKAKQIGYDAVQIHAAHGYLVSQFLSSKSNQRQDSWGGRLENKVKLLLEIYREIRSQTGSNYPVLVKINNSDEPREGFPVEEACKVTRWLADAGINAIEVSGNQSTRTKFEEEGYFTKNAKRIKEQIGDTPLSVVGGLRSIHTIQKIRQDYADFISLSRPFIREPDLVKKFQKGKKQADCISCNKCFSAPKIITCLEKEE